ncbi:hypothetical protein WN990_07795 [Kitasatospora purpeofusca]|uniref:hypothetical protein n=1 Tax=Kitasatospora purpeofusca TaxID=67352 RepID=UPI0030F16BE5
MSSFRCPQCGEVDQVRSVQAVRDSQIGTFTGQGTGYSYDRTPTTIYTFGASSSQLADRLAPPPVPRMAEPRNGCGIVAMLFVAVGAGLFSVLAVTTGSDDPDGRRAAMIGYGVVATIFLLVAVGLISSRRRHLRQARQEFEAYTALYPSLVTAWQSSYVCGRCHLSFLPNGVIDLGLGRTAMAPIDRFPDLVAFVAARLRGE